MKIRNKFLPLTCLAIAAVLLSGCATSSIYSGSTYTANQVKRAQSVHFGTVISVTKADIQSNQNSNVGAVIGGVAGGVLGNTLGGGAGNVAATVGGALLGAVAGSVAQNQINSTDAVQLVIRVSNGRVISVVQKFQKGFYPGVTVQIVGNINGKGHINVVPLPGSLSQYVNATNGGSKTRYTTPSYNQGYNGGANSTNNNNNNSNNYNYNSTGSSNGGYYSVSNSSSSSYVPSVSVGYTI